MWESNWRWNVWEMGFNNSGILLLARNHPGFFAHWWMAKYTNGSSYYALGSLALVPTSINDFTVFFEITNQRFPYGFPVDPD